MAATAIVATGALMTHGFVEGAGMQHFKHRPTMDDEDLYQKGYNRVYDTIELEKNLDSTEQMLRESLAGLEDGTILSSHLINDLLPRSIHQESSILHFCNFILTYHTMCLLCKWHM